MPLNCEYMNIENPINRISCLISNNLKFSVFTSPESSVIIIPSGLGLNPPAQRQGTKSNVYIFTVKKCWDSPQWCWTDWWEAAQCIVGMEVVSPESWIGADSFVRVGTRTRSLSLWSAAKHQAKMSRTINSKNKLTEKHSVSHSCVFH